MNGLEGNSPRKHAFLKQIRGIDFSVSKGQARIEAGSGQPASNPVPCVGWGGWGVGVGSASWVWKHRRKEARILKARPSKMDFCSDSTLFALCPAILEVKGGPF